MIQLYICGRTLEILADAATWSLSESAARLNVPSQQPMAVSFGRVERCASDMLTRARGC